MDDPGARPTRRALIRGLGIVGLGLLAARGPIAFAAPAVRAPLPTDGPALVDPDESDAPLSPPVTVRVGQVVATSEAGQFIALERGYFAEQLDRYVRQGQVTGAVDLDQVVDRSFVEAAVRRLG